MYHSQTALEPPLPLSAYYSEEHWEQEQEAIFARSWFLVAAASQLERPGQFVSMELLGIPLLLRNFQGEIVALRNVCAHRQCLLVQQPTGCAEKLACPFHGWEYGADGRTRRLPGAQNFPHFQHGEYCLDRFPVARCGELVFVRFSEEGVSFDEWIGDRKPLFESWASAPEFRMVKRLRLEYPVNWKIPVEGSLESYHIPAVHPQTFVEDPGESRSEHEFHDSGTSFKTKFLVPRWIDRRMRDAEWLVMWLLNLPFDATYYHHHVFPNLMISHTNSITVVQMVYPTGPSSSWSYVFHLSRQGTGKGLFARLYTWIWGHLSAYVSKQILYEDVEIYPLVQQGMQAARKPGILGRCEERLYALQKFVRERTGDPSHEPHLVEACPRNPESASSPVTDPVSPLEERTT